MFVDIAGATCVLIGGGDVAERKIQSLVECDADVVVISPEVTAGIEELAGQGRVTIQKRGYTAGDLKSAALAIVATNDGELNRRVHQEAIENNIPVNLVDAPELCTFIVPSTVRRGDLVIGISTSGSCPILAQNLRKELQQIFGEEYATYCNVLREFRAEVTERYDTSDERRRALERLIESDCLGLIKEGKIREAEERVRSCI